MKGTGFICSTPNPNDIVYDKMINFNDSIPDSYKLSYPNEIIDLGQEPICVSCVMKDIIDFKSKMDPAIKPVDIHFIYNLKSDKKTNGMSPREAFEILVKDKKGKIFAKVNSLYGIKRAILANGPVLIAMYVRSFDSNFWIGTQEYGGHAISIVGWNPKNLIIKNSWGKDWGSGGYTELPNYNFNLILECWTLIN